MSDKAEIKELVKLQRQFFRRNVTLDVEFRLKALARLKRYILMYEKEIEGALRRDLGKGVTEGYMSEIGLVLSEITYMQRHVKKLSEISAGCDGLLFQQYSPRCDHARRAVRGAVIGFSDFHTRIHIYRAIIEGINFAHNSAIIMLGNCETGSQS